MAVQSRGLYGLLDRDAEIAAIDAAVARALGGDAGLLVVRGPAGIGKSTLLRVGGRSAEGRGLIVLRARAAPFERGFPFGVVRQLFEPVLARAEPAGDELFAGAAAGARAVLGDEPVVSLAPDALFVGLHALYWLTANVASRAPVLVCADDVIWCDEASLRFLEFLVRRLEGMPVLVALAYRTGEPGSSDVVEALASDPLAEIVQPAPLSAAALEAMLAGELAEEVDPAFCTACLEATGGNPLLVAELVRALRGRGPSARECGPPGARDRRGGGRSGGAAATGLVGRAGEGGGPRDLDPGRRRSRG